MRNVAPSHALVRRSRQLLLLAFLVVAIGTFLAVIGLALFILPFAPLGNDAYNVTSGVVFIAGVVIGLAGLGLGVRAVTWRTENDLALIAGQFLEQHLDNQYTLIRNISKIGLGYIDAVLVGPQGVLVLRILDNEGTFFNERSQWLKQVKSGEWSPMRFNPTRRETLPQLVAHEFHQSGVHEALAGEHARRSNFLAPFFEWTSVESLLPFGDRYVNASLTQANPRGSASMILPHPYGQYEIRHSSARLTLAGYSAAGIIQTCCQSLSIEYTN